MNDWSPTYSGTSEGEIRLSGDLAGTYSHSDNELGISLPFPAEDYQDEGALFWIDTQHLYLRFNWTSWYPVSGDNAPQCAEICRRHSVILMLYSSNVTRRHTIPVYHLESLPSFLFGDVAEPAT